MKNIKLSNPLTIEEKLQITRLIGHDSSHCIWDIKRNLNNKDLALSLLTYLANIELTIIRLTQNNEFNLTEHCSIDYFKGNDVERLMNNLRTIHDNKLKTYVESHFTFLSVRPILDVVLGNLVKNAFEVQEEGKETVILRSEYYSKFPENALFIPEGAKDFQDFMAFYVQDMGKGFPQNCKWQDYFTTCPEKGERGFGLYFTGLAAKVLRAPVSIKSQPGDTTVAFYHPIYVNDSN